MILYLSLSLQNKTLALQLLPQSLVMSKMSTLLRQLAADYLWPFLILVPLLRFHSSSVSMATTAARAWAARAPLSLSLSLSCTHASRLQPCWESSRSQGLNVISGGHSWKRTQGRRFNVSSIRLLTATCHHCATRAYADIDAKAKGIGQCVCKFVNLAKNSMQLTPMCLCHCVPDMGWQCDEMCCDAGQSDRCPLAESAQSQYHVSGSLEARASRITEEEITVIKMTNVWASEHTLYT